MPRAPLLFALLTLLPLGCATPAPKPAPEPAAPAKPQSREALSRALTRAYIESDPNIPFKPTFLGTPSWQNPCDLWMFQQLITELQPDIIIETGTAKGGTALYFAQVLEALELPGAKVLTVDIEPQVTTAKEHPLWKKRVEFIVGDALADETLALLRERCRGKTVMVTLDSLHGARHVSKELERYAPLVTPGSYLVVQDTVIDDDPRWVEQYASLDGSDAGPAKALEAFLPAHPEFEVDRSREAFVLTFHRGGWLRRKAE